MKVTGDWLTRQTTQDVCAMLTGGGHQALLVGGCVRNALLDAPVSDIDISTDALPDRVIELAKEVGLKAIPTGKEHGTITVIAGGIPHEITTFRKDVETDGRRAVVAFSDCVEDDAHRRDFTMNALYVKPDGTLVDPLGGLQDLHARRFVFIDDADMRIREDYLRILRFFRFNAWYGDPSAGLDAEALAAIAANSDGIESLSKERVGTEMLKLLSASDPAPAVAAMRQSGALAQVLEGADDKPLAPLVHFEAEAGVASDPIRRLAALGGQGVEKALRLSKKDAARLEVLREETGAMTPVAEIAYRQGADLAISVILLRSAMFEQPLPHGFSEEIAMGATAIFPIKAADLLDQFQGPELGAKLKALESAWIKSGFALDKDTLLEM
ncbi:CCA tRNA nucleotidyltransferase [Cognatishimia activa]|uniref:CCA-adding enzyme n=1 Tax=Cognatishimia activa TaxID=1715691 RepID=A0A0N7MB72_9RHOB|nr:CCA tRNA nucleotidyltransferase [Cognatishimia activa]CUI42358.1 CCA-adding enzyme [Cognatishimia activa]CUK24600.1 CCA-adding enzyme [Cognatishimia activa]